MPRVALLPGDGVGPEVIDEAVKALRAVERRFAIVFDVVPIAIGGDALDRYGLPLRLEDVRVVGDSDAALLGAVGGPAWDAIEPALRPERGLLQIRKALNLFANLRPVKVLPTLAESSPLKSEIVANVDLLVVRELTGGIYFGKPSRRFSSGRGRSAVDTMRYREDEIERVVRIAFELARSRRGRLTSVDKSNVLQSSRLWREIVDELAPEFPGVVVEHILVDAMSIQLVKKPGRFDVIVTENMFGDILSDEASVISGSIGLLPSASLSGKPGRRPGTRYGLYEPIHGSAPNIAGTGRANPAGAILSAGMLLRWSLGLSEAALTVDQAVADTIASDVRTPDIAAPGTPPVTTAAFGDEVARRIEES